jgi:hypothetical protein
LRSRANGSEIGVVVLKFLRIQCNKSSFFASKVKKI